jgi:hypothetical protein
LSLIRNDAGTHAGVAQLGLGRNLADSFYGGLQLSLSENRARNFVGLGQTALVYNRGGDVTAAYQLAAYNRARVFRGVLQLGGYDRTDESFAGVAQLGLFDHARGDFTGLLQAGVVVGTGPELLPDEAGHASTRFAGALQVGAISVTDGRFYGLAQLGAVSFTSEDFTGLLQVGAFVADAERFHGLAQIGALTLTSKSQGMQVGGVAIAREEHTGLQAGALANYAGSIDGAQIGVVNLAGRVRGVQIGVFNYAHKLRGVQIGLANHADDGVLPWTAILNMGFGDGDGGAVDEENDANVARAE